MRSPLLIMVFLSMFPAFPASGSDDRLIEVPTRPDVTVPVYLMKRGGAAATLVLLPGGKGGLGLKKEVPDSDDFLVRNRKQFVRRGFNVAVVGKPADIGDLDLRTRKSPQHLRDLHKVVQYLMNDEPLPVWLVGASRGTVSAAAAAIAFGNEDLAGIVLASSVTTTASSDSVPGLHLSRIQVPVLVLHHRKDACDICDPEGVRDIMTGLANVPVSRAVLVNGGWLPTGKPCSATHWHGYSGMEQEAVDIIARWIREPHW